VNNNQKFHELLNLTGSFIVEKIILQSTGSAGVKKTTFCARNEKLFPVNSSDFKDKKKLEVTRVNM
jgi:hypothetical protein